MTLRQQYFELLCSAYQLAKDIAGALTKKQHYSLTKIAYGMKSILPNLRWIWQYDADDTKWLSNILEAAQKVNILLNSLQSGNFKSLLQKLYDQLCQMLPGDFQLSLFANEWAFGWASTYSPLPVGNWKTFCKALLDFIGGSKAHAWAYPQHYRLASRFKSFSGRQFTLPSGFSGVPF